MILTALTRYYEALVQRGVEIEAKGYGKSNVSYGLNLGDDGQLRSLLPLLSAVPSGKKMVERPTAMRVPEPVMKSGTAIVPNFLCDGSAYLLGFDDKGKPEMAQACFEASKAFHRKLLKDVDTPMARAIKRFFDTWDSPAAISHEALQPFLESLMKGAKLIFVQGTSYAQEDPEILSAWERYYNSREGGEQGICLVKGERTAIARLHPKIKGVRGGHTAGVSLVSFNDRAYESYGHDEEQGLNAPVGEYAAFAYTTALNALIADPKHRTFLGDMTIVYWSEDGNEAASEIANLNFDPFPELSGGQNGTNTSENIDAVLRDTMQKLARGEPIGKQIDMTCPFYILGLAPNAARVSVRFFLRDSFGGLINQLNAHYKRMQIAPEGGRYVRITHVLDALSNPKVTTEKKPPDVFTGTLLRDILAGTRYPESMLVMAMMRIRADQDNPEKRIQKISRERVAIIKAYLLKNASNQYIKEECTVSLNEKSTNRAYVLGRLFSVLESVQEGANPGINATIKARYFNSACATPATVYPALLKLSNHHLRQLVPGARINNEKLLTELIGKLEGEPLPARLTLEEQGLFTIGYYHQSQVRYTKKEQKEEGDK